MRILLHNPKNAWGWLRLLAQHRVAIYEVIRGSFTIWDGRAGARTELKLNVGLGGRERDAV